MLGSSSIYTQMRRKERWQYEVWYKTRLKTSLTKQKMRMTLKKKEPELTRLTWQIQRIFR